MSKNNLGADYNDDTLKMGQQRPSRSNRYRYQVHSKNQAFKTQLTEQRPRSAAIEKMDLFLAEKYPSSNVKKSLEARYYDRHSIELEH